MCKFANSAYNGNMSGCQTNVTNTVKFSHTEKSGMVQKAVTARIQAHL